MSVRLKASLLLILFSLKTIIALVCAVSDNSYCNFIYHVGTELTTNEKSGHPDKSGKYHTSKDCKINYSNYQVKEFTEVDKSTRQVYSIDVVHDSKVPLNIKYFVQSHRLSIPDIRIAIRSLQI